MTLFFLPVFFLPFKNKIQHNTKPALKSTLSSSPLPSYLPSFHHPSGRLGMTGPLSVSSAERSRHRAGQPSGRAGLLLPGLSQRKAPLPPLPRAPGRLQPVAVLLPRRAGHLSGHHAMQLVDRPHAGSDLSSRTCQWSCK